MQTTATLTSKGQVTIPKAIRDEIDLREKDKLVFSLLDRSIIAFKPVKQDFLNFGASIKPRKQPEDFAAIRKQVTTSLATKVAEK